MMRSTFIIGFAAAMENTLNIQEVTYPHDVIIDIANEAHALPAGRGQRRSFSSPLDVCDRRATWIPDSLKAAPDTRLWKRSSVNSEAGLFFGEIISEEGEDDALVLLDECEQQAKQFPVILNMVPDSYALEWASVNKPYFPDDFNTLLEPMALLRRAAADNMKTVTEICEPGNITPKQIEVLRAAKCSVCNLLFLFYPLRSLVGCPQSCVSLKEVVSKEHSQYHKVSLVHSAILESLNRLFNVRAHSFDLMAHSPVLNRDGVLSAAPGRFFPAAPVRFRALPPLPAAKRFGREKQV